MDAELLKIVVSLRIVEGLLIEAAKELKEVTEQIRKYIKEEAK